MIVEKNQTKIYNLVMDVCSSFSEGPRTGPGSWQPDLNETIGDVAELIAVAAELGVQLNWHPCDEMPRVMIDAEGIHRAVLNIVTNAIDASEGAENAKVVIKTAWDAQTSVARIEASPTPACPGIRRAPTSRRSSSRSSHRAKVPAAPASDCRSLKKSSASTAARSRSPPGLASERPF